MNAMISLYLGSYPLLCFVQDINVLIVALVANIHFKSHSFVSPYSRRFDHYPTPTQQICAPTQF